MAIRDVNTYLVDTTEELPEINILQCLLAIVLHWFQR